ncbi:hypothetical protein KP509_38G005700 [Ceratopteris richardii]|uniref:Uncharacterized protein n=1 Tax=Ceratopteris richardii TaxID=49495 RepID=A0A8T2Q264_CERRI|nr:hypothetical protein KP509_38G005700 [Ceratopteris richardii]
MACTTSDGTAKNGAGSSLPTTTTRYSYNKCAPANALSSVTSLVHAATMQLLSLAITEQLVPNTVLISFPKLTNTVLNQCVVAQNHLSHMHLARSERSRRLPYRICLQTPAPVQYKTLSLPQQMVTWQETWCPAYAVAFLYVYYDDVSLLLYFSLAGSQVNNNGSPPDSSMMRFLARVLIQIMSFEYITIAVTLMLMLLPEQKFLLHLKSMFPFQVSDRGGAYHDVEKNHPQPPVFP